MATVGGIARRLQMPGRGGTTPYLSEVRSTAAVNPRLLSRFCWPRALDARRRCRAAQTVSPIWREAALFHDRSAEASTANWRAARDADRTPRETDPVDPNPAFFRCPARRLGAHGHEALVAVFRGLWRAVSQRAVEGAGLDNAPGREMGQDKRACHECCKTLDRTGVSGACPFGRGTFLGFSLRFFNAPACTRCVQASIGSAHDRT